MSADPSQKAWEVVRAGTIHYDDDSPPFVDKETEAHKGEITCLRSHSWLMAKPDLEPSSLQFG